MQSLPNTSASISPLLARVVTATFLTMGFVALILFANTWVIIGFLFFVFFLALFEFLKLHPQSQGYLLATEKKSLKTKIELLSHASLGVIYLFPTFYFIIKLLQTPDYQFLFFVCMAATALGDTFAYFGGRTFGKRKLAPVISPNKTLEGAYAALLGGALGSVLLHTIYNRPEALWQQLLLGVVLAVIGIYGDLAESALKRAFSVKDSGNILPGHGGVLDRIDAYLFTLPAVYFYSQWILK